MSGRLSDTVAQALREAAALLADISDTARLDAELLMAHALGVSRSDMLLRHQGSAAPDQFAALAERRASHEPVAYLTGTQEFYGLTFRVNSDVLIPRGDSESLIEAARTHFHDKAPARILDLGTGSGALLCAALHIWPAAHGMGIDASARALDVAAANAKQLGQTGRAQFREASWRDDLRQDGLGRFDLILCNPPYVETEAPLEPGVRDWEPASALFAGEDGLDDYKILIPQLRALMTDGGAAVLEIGASQSRTVTALAQAAGFAVCLRRDLAERPRALLLTRGC